MTEENCVFCRNPISVQHKIRDYTQIDVCDCTNCGKYKILEMTARNPEVMNHPKRHLFSGYIREMNELNLPLELITIDNYKSILSSPLIPKTTMEKLEKLLMYIYRKTEQLNQEVKIDENMPAIAYAKNREELEQMILTLINIGYLDLPHSFGHGYSLKLDGLQRAERLQKEVVNSTQCFVAIWFDENMMDIYNKYIAKAVEDAGYQPLNISQKEHNDKICDQIIAEIRKSKFLIADFTGNRGGVYFEAGFAHGLGLPVIWTCRKNELGKLHFDVNHYNFIVWETGEELFEKLKYRIQATIL